MYYTEMREANWCTKQPISGSYMVDLVNDMHVKDLNGRMVGVCKGSGPNECTRKYCAQSPEAKCYSRTDWRYMSRYKLLYPPSECLYGGQFTLSTQLIKPNYVVILPPTQHHSFFRNLPPLSFWLSFV